YLRLSVHSWRAPSSQREESCGPWPGYRMRYWAHRQAPRREARPRGRAWRLGEWGRPAVVLAWARREDAVEHPRGGGCPVPHAVLRGAAAVQPPPDRRVPRAADLAGQVHPQLVMTVSRVTVPLAARPCHKW